jgi:hypothetical protein
MADVFYHSAEIRWFLAGQSVPDDPSSDPTFKWFKGTLGTKTEDDLKRDPTAATDPFVKAEKERTDKYLLFPDADTASFKQREGKLEIKALVAGPRPFSAGTVTGRMDQWVKWSFSPSPAKIANAEATLLGKQLAAEMGQAGPWQAVTKVRCLQKYSFDTGQLVSVSPELRPDTGCQVELTWVSVQATVATWLTFGFEAFGPSGRVMALLDEAVEHFFAVHGQAPLPLDGRDSLSYPAWLALLR